MEPRVMHQVLSFFSSRRRHTRLQGDWSSDVCSSDLLRQVLAILAGGVNGQSFLRADRAAPDPDIVDQGIGDARTAAVSVVPLTVLANIDTVTEVVRINVASG